MNKFFYLLMVPGFMVGVLLGVFFLGIVPVLICHLLLDAPLFGPNADLCLKIAGWFGGTSGALFVAATVWSET